MPPPLPRPDSRTRMAAPRREKRGKAGLIATISVVVLLVVVTGILATRMLNGAHGSNANGGHASTGSATPPVPEVGMNTPKMTYPNMRAELLKYYGLLPGDTEDAFGYLAPNFRPKVNFAEYQAFYGSLSAVSIRDIVPDGPNSVNAVVTFVKVHGGTTHEPYHFVFTPGTDRLLIVSGARVGSNSN